MIDVKRSPEAPASLAKKKRYNEEDVLQALFRDFVKKCYLCEGIMIHYGVMEVDHRIPVDVDETKKFEWTNLYPICRPYFCNQRRVRKRVPDGGWLNPGEGVETRICQCVDEEPSTRSDLYVKLRFEAVDPTDTPAKNTAIELDRIHNATGSDHDSNAPSRAKALRYAIAAHYERIRDKLAKLERVGSTDPVEADALKYELRELLSHDAPFFMLMQSYFRQIPSAKEFLSAGV